MRPENPHWEALGRWQGWAKDGKWQGQRGERWAGELGTYENAGSKSKGSRRGGRRGPWGVGTSLCNYEHHLKDIIM